MAKVTSEEVRAANEAKAQAKARLRGMMEDAGALEHAARRLECELFQAGWMADKKRKMALERARFAFAQCTKLAQRLEAAFAIETPAKEKGGARGTAH